MLLAVSLVFFNENIKLRCSLLDPLFYFVSNLGLCKENPVKFGALLFYRLQ